MNPKIEVKVEANIEDKDKKISDLRNLLGQAKTKLENFKNILQSRDLQIQQLTTNYEKKLKVLQNESAQIMKQYQERLIRYQKSLQDSQALVAKHHHQNQINSQQLQSILASITQIGNLTTKVFTLELPKEKSDAVEQLCNIQKCKEYMNQIQKISREEVEPIVKAIRKLVDLYSITLSKKRDARLACIKKDTMLKKQQEDYEGISIKLHQKIKVLEKEKNQREVYWQHKLEEIMKNKVKNEDKTNEQFVKQLFLKVINGPTQASIMAFQILSKVLKLNQQQYKKCVKKIK